MVNDVLGGVSFVSGLEFLCKNCVDPRAGLQ